MITDSKKLIFIHIPKTAGTSIKHSLSITNRDVGYHATHDKVKSRYPNKWKTYFKFTFVRNPFDRVYSIFSYYKMGKTTTSVDPNVIPATFEEFVLNLDKYLTILGLNFNQCDYIGNEMDYVGKVENIDNDYKEICKRNNIEFNGLPKKRTSNRVENYRDVYTEEMVGIVSEYFKKDITKFSYEY